MDGYYFKQIIFENLNYEISIEKSHQKAHQISQRWMICNYLKTPNNRSHFFCRDSHINFMLVEFFRSVFYCICVPVSLRCISWHPSAKWLVSKCNIRAAAPFRPPNLPRKLFVPNTPKNSQLDVLGGRLVNSYLWAQMTF